MLYKWSMETANSVVIAGASGMLGTALTENLRSVGWKVTKLVRSRPQGEDEIQWDPAGGELDPQVLAGADAVVCLSGAPLVRWPWTKAYQRELVKSRLDPVDTIVSALESLRNNDRPHSFLSASAVGYYGDRGEEVLTEDSGGADDFLAGLCRTWEEHARRAPVECTTQIRTGIVVGDGGFIKALQPLAKLAVLGPVGSGEQWLPPIALSDHARAVRFALEKNLDGAVNLVGPQPYRHREVMAEIARAAGHSPAPRVPEPMVRLALGRMSQVVLTSQRVIPTRLESAGFEYQYPTLAEQVAHTPVAEES